MSLQTPQSNKQLGAHSWLHDNAQSLAWPVRLTSHVGMLGLIRHDMHSSPRGTVALPEPVSTPAKGWLPGIMLAGVGWEGLYGGRFSDGRGKLAGSSSFRKRKP